MSVTSALPASVPITSVQINLQTLLKILQHARDITPNPATGQLLGMDNGATLEVTDAFPFAVNIQDEIDQEDYQVEMIKSLRDVNVDHNTVGWYQSSSFDSFISQTLVEAQFNYQSTIFNSVVLIYDHLLSVQGPPAIKALRLKNDFMALYRDRKAKVFSAFVGMDMFEVLPVKIHLSSLDQLLISQLVEGNALPPVGSVPVLETDQLILSFVAENLVSSVDDVIGETGRLLHYLRSTAKQQQALSTQLQRLKHENAQRTQAGEDTIPVASVISNFRPSVEPSRIPCLIASSSLHALIEEFKSYSGIESTTLEAADSL